MSKHLVISVMFVSTLVLAGCRGTKSSESTKENTADSQATVDQSAEETEDQSTAESGGDSLVSDEISNEKKQEHDSASSGRPLFIELDPKKSGVEFKHRLVEDHPRAYLYHSGFQCGGVCLGDVNGDDLADIFLVSGPDENALFINQGEMRFKRAKIPAKLEAVDAWGVGANLSDVDGDDDLDLYICNYDSANQLWLNDGADEEGVVQFRQCSSESGVDYQGPSHTPYFTDIDLDGDLDLFVLTNRLHSPTGRPKDVAYEYNDQGKQVVKGEYSKYLRIVYPKEEFPHSQQTPDKFMLEYGYEDRLYLNEGTKNGVPKFRDVTAKTPLHEVFGHGLSALTWDINQDNLPDIYVANDYSDLDRLWLNLGVDQDGVPQFRDATTDYLPYTSWFSMGSDIADINGDGILDFMVADMAATTHFKAKTTMGEMSGWRRWVLENGWPRQAMRNMLFIDSRVGRFRETGFIAGVANSDWTWSVKFADFDLDGRNDLFLTNGTARMFSDSDIFVRPEMMVGKTEWDIFRDTPEMREQNLAFRNKDGQKFANVSKKWNLGKNSMSFGAATGDLDGDGDLDLVVCNLTENVSVYQNTASSDGANWLRVKLEGSQNRKGIGAIVKAKLSDGSIKTRLMNPQSGFLSGNEPVLHFGLGESTIKSLEVKWPDGKTQELVTVATNQTVVVKRTNEAEMKVATPTPPTTFTEVASEIGLDFRHQETPFDDYRREFLLPGKLSQFGPGIAVSDINGDQRDDIYIGGASKQAGVLFVSSDNGYQPLKDAPWVKEAVTEDMGALFFDADRDGDLDLYVVRGSNEWAPGLLPYQDSLFLNESTADEVKFVKAASDAMPRMRESGSCVVGADFDKDGDVDLFVGARSRPGEYPLVPKSTFLRNESTKAGEVRFVDATEEVCADLREPGLVTSAIWSDVNNDGAIDLLVACEWGSTRLFVNQRGLLVDATSATELGTRLGWWNAITGADIDNDGDIDYVVTNVGHNTKYGAASKKKPAILYRGDMDLNGVFDLVEAKSTEQGELPVRGRSCSCNAMPALRSKFPTYKGFASEGLSGIYSEQLLRTSKKLVANEFASGIWINNSTKTKISFQWKPLPFDAQVSPGYGIVATDLFGNGRPSISIAQNLDSREPETGIWRAGLGCVFDVDSSSSNEMTLNSLPLHKTGFVVEGDGKGLVVADLDADGCPDLVATQNNGQALAFHQRTQENRFAIRLKGKAGNPTGLGAKIELLEGEKRVAMGEVHGGSGYLSQSSPALYTTRKLQKNLTVLVTWPSGQTTTTPANENDVNIYIAEP